MKTTRSNLRRFIRKTILEAWAPHDSEDPVIAKAKARRDRNLTQVFGGKSSTSIDADRNSSELKIAKVVKRQEKQKDEDLESLAEKGFHGVTKQTLYKLSPIYKGSEHILVSTAVIPHDGWIGVETVGFDANEDGARGNTIFEFNENIDEFIGTNHDMAISTALGYKVKFEGNW